MHAPWPGETGKYKALATKKVGQEWGRVGVWGDIESAGLTCFGK